MAFTCGFFNSDGGDRKYNAEQISAIFDGIISDGVFATIGDHMAVTPGTGMQVLVGTGKAWFDHTWNVNDSLYSLEIAKSDVSLDRIDAVVLETNHSDSVRFNGFKVIQGSPSGDPIRPALTRDELINQHPLAWVRVKAGATAITASMIENAVGKTECPFVTGVVEVTSIDDLFNQWEGEFDEWFANLKTQLSGDVAANLQRQIDECKASTPTKALYGLPPEATNDDVFKRLSGSTWEETAEMYSLAVPALLKDQFVDWLSVNDGIECIYGSRSINLCIGNYGKKIYIPLNNEQLTWNKYYTTFYLTPEYDYCFENDRTVTPNVLKIVKLKTNTDTIVSTLYTVYTDGKYESNRPLFYIKVYNGLVYLYCLYLNPSGTQYGIVLSFNPMTEEIKVVKPKSTSTPSLNNFGSFQNICLRPYATYINKAAYVQTEYYDGIYADSPQTYGQITTPQTIGNDSLYVPIIHSKNIAYILPTFYGMPIHPEYGSFRSSDGINWTQDTRIDSLLSSLGKNGRIHASFFKEDTLYLITDSGVGYEIPLTGEIIGPIDLSYIDPRAYYSKYSSGSMFHDVIQSSTKYLVGLLPPPGFDSGRYNSFSSIYPEKIKINYKKGYESIPFDDHAGCYNVGFKVEGISTVYGTFGKPKIEPYTQGAVSSDGVLYIMVFGTETVTCIRRSRGSGSNVIYYIGLGQDAPYIAFGGD